MSKATSTTRTRRVVVVDNSDVARAIGGRIRAVRTSAGMTQAALSGDRYTPAYISALERGLAKPSMASLTYIAARLNTTVSDLVENKAARWTRLVADLYLAAEDWDAAHAAFSDLLIESTENHDRALIQRGLAEALCRLGRGTEAIAPAAAAAEQLAAFNDVAGAALARYWLAYAHFQCDDLDDARDILQGLRSDTRHGLDVQDDFRLRVLVASASLEIREGAFQRANSYLSEASAIAENLDARRRASYLFSVAMQYQETGDVEGALSAGGKALVLFELAAAGNEIASLKNTMALALIELGNLDRARAYLADASAALESQPTSRLRAHVSETRARLLLAEGRLDDAGEAAAEAQALAKSTGNFHALANATITAARIARRQNAVEESIVRYQEAAELLEQHRLRRRRSEVLAEWAQLLTEQGDHRAANALFSEAFGAHHS